MGNTEVFRSPWNHASSPQGWYRKACPICGAGIPRDNGYGSFEMHEYCPVDSWHYSDFMSMYATSITIQGKHFDLEKANTPEKREAVIRAIHDWLEQVGWKEFM